MEHPKERDVSSKEKSDESRESIGEGIIDRYANIDDAILRANGHEAAMRRQFNWLSALGLGFSITNSWIGYLSCFGQNLIYGGPQSAIFGLVVAFFAQFTVTLGLSEIASAFPSSGGQYHFCYILAPEKSKKFTAFVIGWLSVIAWWIVTCSGLSLFAITLSGVINFWIPDFVASGWQIYLIYVATGLSTVTPVIFASKHLAWVVQFSLWASILGFLLFLFVSTGMHSTVQDGSFLTDSGFGTSGWNPSTAWLLGIANAMYAFGATDGAIHISEEMEQPGRRVPQVMIMTMMIGIVTSLPLMVALLLFAKDLDAIVASPLPSMELVYQATGSKSVTMFLVAVLLLTYYTCLPSQWVTDGRLAWAFARDNGVPYSKYFTHINPKMELPLRTTIAAFIFSTLYGLLYLASTTAFNSIITSAVLFLNITYAVPQGILLFQGREKSLPTRYLRLGYLGYFCNLFSILFIVLLGVLVCMPPAIPVTIQSMNYTSVVMVGLFFIVIILWFVNGKKNFNGPKIDWELLEASNAALTEGRTTV
ncbi:unnamed protein product [Clonostachys rosea]|uniref:Choline transporter n=1 Tax=Bionectria ochroleuca TaxID=29856 RepID=A0ABY6UEU8_BIOOC|nr:unnamed protein product [Clonostachys rosea]